jgi:hypothetical protein
MSVKIQTGWILKQDNHNHSLAGRRSLKSINWMKVIVLPAFPSVAFTSSMSFDNSNFDSCLFQALSMFHAIAKRNKAHIEVEPA